MAGSFNNKDSFDIQELANLNEDISVDFIEQLQNQIAQSANDFSDKNNDGALFEEVETTVTVEPEEIPTPQKEKKSAPKQTLDETIDDNFIKKYKAKLNKQTPSPIEKDDNPVNLQEDGAQNNSFEEIENLTSGNIIEKPLVQELIDYNTSLDYLDDNIKYSKYVIYISPENKEFIDSLTVKERKNLINKILKEQGDIVLTKKRFKLIQSIIKHSIVAIITIAIATPIVYHIINASLEASINNYRNSQTLFKTLYKEKGKIKATSEFN